MNLNLPLWFVVIATGSLVVWLLAFDLFGLLGLAAIVLALVVGAMAINRF